MISDIEFLEAICERMQQVGLVHSKADFSARILGKGPSYLTSMSARDRKVPDEVIMYLAEQLRAGIEDDGNAITGLKQQIKQHERDRQHREDLRHWLNRHREKISDTKEVFVGKSSSVWQSMRETVLRWMMGQHRPRLDP